MGFKNYGTAVNLNTKENKLFSTLLDAYGATAPGFPLEIAVVGFGVNTMLTFPTIYIEEPDSMPKELQDFMYLYEIQKFWRSK